MFVLFLSFATSDNSTQKHQLSSLPISSFYDGETEIDDEMKSPTSSERNPSVKLRSYDTFS